MEKHKRIYFEYFGIDESSYVFCEICTRPGHDIHHIDARGMGGSANKDFIENLMCLCRKCHEKYGDITERKEWLSKIHADHMKIYQKQK